VTVDGALDVEVLIMRSLDDYRPAAIGDDGLACSFDPILRLRCRTRLPLHVRRIIGTAVLERLNVIDDPTGAGSVCLPRRRAGIDSPECFLGVRIARNLSVRVVLDARVCAALMDVAGRMMRPARMRPAEMGPARGCIR